MIKVCIASCQLYFAYCRLNCIKERKGAQEMKKIKIIILSILFILFLASNLLAANPGELTDVHYSFAGDSFSIDYLKMAVDYKLTPINNIRAGAAFNGDDFNFFGSWQLNFKQAETARMSIDFLLTDEVNNFDLGKAVGLSGESLMQGKKRVFWQTAYFFEDKLADHLYYRIGLAHSINNSTDLTVSFGNSYWNLQEETIDIGLKIEL